MLKKRKKRKDSEELGNGSWPLEKAPDKQISQNVIPGVPSPAGGKQTVAMAIAIGQPANGPSAVACHLTVIWECVFEIIWPCYGCRLIVIHGHARNKANNALHRGGM